MTEKFWELYENRDLEELQNLQGTNHHIPAICIHTASKVALYENDIDLLKSLPFYPRWLLKDVADKPKYLKRLLKVLTQDYLDTHDIPDYVWSKTTSKTRKIFRSYGKHPDEIECEICGVTFPTFKEHRCKTTVVNVKTCYLRPKYQNLKQWMDEDKHVYIGRKRIVFIDGKRFPEEDSPWANPYKVGRDGTREEVVRKYRRYIKRKIKDGDVDLEDLRGKILGCWCKPDNCHGDILVELLSAE